MSEAPDVFTRKWIDLLQAGKREKARRFYNQDVFPIVMESFAKANANKLSIDVLISLVGMSPEPLILTIVALQPQRVVFIVSDESEFLLDSIVEKTALPPSRFDKYRVSSSISEEIYQVVYQNYRRNPALRYAIDISGGKKVMVGGAAQAATIIKAQVVYVDYGEYLSDFRKPKPFTEYLAVLGNPMEIFGHLELEQAYMFYRHGNFFAARDRLGILVRQIRHPDQVRILIQLIDIQRAWEQLQFEDLDKRLRHALNEAVRFGIWDDLAEQVEPRLELLQTGREEDHRGMLTVVSLYGVSLLYKERQWYDFSILLLYRALEKALSSYLEQHYHISADAPAYPDSITIEAYNEVVLTTYGDHSYSEVKLPGKLGMMNCAIILRLLKSELLEGIDLKKINSQAMQRNHSILAHGDRNNSKKEYQAMRAVFHPILSKYVDSIRPGSDIDKMAHLLEPIRISALE